MEAVGFSKKRMIAGGRSRLSAYQVRGWTLQPLKHQVTLGEHIAGEPKSITVTRICRVPLGRVEVIKAVSGYEAAKAYARSRGITDSMWITGTDIIIRVSNFGERAP